jgi:hypothetical protein
MSGEQVLTHGDDASLQKSADVQHLADLSDQRIGAQDTLLVNGASPEDSGQTPPTAEVHHGLAHDVDRVVDLERNRLGRRTPKGKRGGWPSSRWLTWGEVKEVSAVIYALRKAGFPPTHMVSVMPAMDGDLSARKVFCGRKVAHLGQALKRHGHRHYGITIFEHRHGVDLHAHHVLHLPHGERRTIERLAAPPEVDVQPITDLGGLEDYLTKERQPLPPKFESDIQRRREPCLALPGMRWSITTAVRELLADSAPWPS